MKTTASSMVFLSGLALTGNLSAATIANATRTAVVFATPTHNLTPIGTSDWAVWNTSADPAAGTPAQQKNNATLITTTLVAVGGGALRGSGSGVTHADFSYSDGSPTTAGSINNATGLFNTGLNTTGRGVGLNITLPTIETYRITVWTAAFNGTANFIAAITGATSYTNSYSAIGNGPKDTYAYTFDVTPDTINDVLSITHTLTDDGDAFNSSHVIIAAVAVSVIPEPTSALLLSLGSLLAFRRRR